MDLEWLNRHFLSQKIQEPAAPHGKHRHAGLGVDVAPALQNLGWRITYLA